MAYNAGMPAGASLREQAAAAVGGTRAQRLYFEDVWSWSREQAEALRRRDWDALDLENVIEEIEDVGNRHSDAWTSLCRHVLSHLQKIEHSGSEENYRHWSGEIEAWRDDMFGVLASNPGMKHRLPEMLAKAWKLGRKDAVRELVKQGRPDGLAAEKSLRRQWQSRLPEGCPYHLEDVAGYDPHDKDAEPCDDVWPAPVARALNEGQGADYPVRYRALEQVPGRSR